MEKKKDNFFDLLQEMMKEQKISVRKLCEGLCSEGEMSKIRQRLRLPKKDMRDRIFARLGIADDRTEKLLDHDEYIKWQTRQKIIKAVKRKNIEEANELLEAYRESGETAERIPQQFFLAMELQLQLYLGADREMLAEKAQQAVKLTVPGIDEKSIKELCLSLQEINLILEYEKYKYPLRLAQRCEEILTYLEESKMEERSKAKIYPKAAYYLCEALDKEDAHYPIRVVQVTNRALEYLRNTQKCHYLWEILDLRERALEEMLRKLSVNDCPHGGDALLSMYQETREWKEAFEAVCRMADYPMKTDNYCYLYMQEEIYSVNEVVRIRRDMLGISRNKLNSETYDEKTLLRMETEKRKTRRETVKTLFERLNLCGELQRVDVIAPGKAARDLLDKLIKYANNFDLENERKTLEELERHIDMEIPLNRQFVKAQQAMIIHGGKRENREAAFEKMKEALECTIPLEKIFSSKKIYLTGGEVGCLYNMAIYQGSAELNAYHELLLNIFTAYEEADEIEQHVSQYAWVLTPIVAIYSQKGEHDKAIDLSKRIIRMSLGCGRLAMVEQNFNCLSWNIIRLHEKCPKNEANSERIKDLEYCVALSEFMRMDKRVKNCKRQIEALQATIKDG